MVKSSTYSVLVLNLNDNAEPALVWSEVNEADASNLEIFAERLFVCLASEKVH